MYHHLFSRRIPSLAALCALLALLMTLSGPRCPGARAEYDAYAFEVCEIEPEYTGNGYTSGNVRIDITSQWVGHSDVYVCDILITNTDCFRRAWGADDWPHETERIGTMAERKGAVLAMTGDNGAYLGSGLIVGNGEILRNTDNTKRDLCVMYRDGRMETFIAAETDMRALYGSLENDPSVWQVFLFGPALLDDEGRALSSFNSNVFPANPRSIIGYYEPGHYCFVQIDGRSVPSALEKGRSSTGLTLAEAAAFMETLGCRAAYNLDGGQSSALWFNGEIVSTPYKGGRKVTDIVYIADLPPLNEGSIIP